MMMEKMKMVGKGKGGEVKKNGRQEKRRQKTTVNNIEKEKYEVEWSKEKRN
jgi:hypothetical protein